MNTTRRRFLKNSVIAFGGTMILPDEIFAYTKSKGMLGVQLYCVRDDMKEKPVDTLKQLAKMGYKNVEHANYVDRKLYGFSPAEFKKILDDNGLKMPSGHTVLNARHWDATTKDFTDKWKYTIEDAALLGQEYVISPWLDESLRKNYDDLLGFLELFNKCGELCKKSGLKYGYHNHDFEFKYSLNNKQVYDIILDNTDPNLVAQQLDIGNMINGGGKAAEVLKKYPGRFELLHVKDEIKSSSQNAEHTYESTILGKGIINVKQIIDLAYKSGGTKHFIVEQEAYQGKAPIECVREDFKIMKKWGY
jgi:sugar phosphate isomerase/epimerase